MAKFSKIVVLLSAAVLGACAMHAVEQPRPAGEVPTAKASAGATPPSPGTAAGALPSPPAASDDAVNYRIDSMQSELRLLVFRAGAMARLGHNHVILNHRIEGWVHWTPNPGDAAFALRVLADGFNVDDEGARREEGDEFTSVVDEGAKNGTLHNMLGVDLLNADVFPALTVRSVRIGSAASSVGAPLREASKANAPMAAAPSAGAPAAATLSAEVIVAVAGHETRVTIPLTVERNGDGLRAHAEFTLRQSQLGLKPFSVMMGALQVRDDFTVKCRIVARR